MTVEINVCIATHRRPEGLDRLLRSLSVQTGAPAFDLIVVDNDEKRSGEPIVDRFRDRLPLTYLVEAVRGVARVRNRAVAAATGPLIAFIDDDEWATPEWLSHLARVARRTRADAVVGQVQSAFDVGTPEYIRHCGLFDVLALADGATVPWFQTRTSNALVRRDALPDRVAPFSTRDDLVGGEDVRMFKRMISRGALIVAAPSAVVFESRPARRSNLRWVIRRAVRNGGTIADFEWEDDSLVRRLGRLPRAARVALGRAIQVALLWNRDRQRAARRLVTACEDFGKVLHLLGIRIEEYRNHP
jgi:succinoglycan biosynthesis protein ExoM